MPELQSSAFCIFHRDVCDLRCDLVALNGFAVGIAYVQNSRVLYSVYSTGDVYELGWDLVALSGFAVGIAYVRVSVFTGAGRPDARQAL
jgi:hypothetical protein